MGEQLPCYIVESNRNEGNSQKWDLVDPVLISRLEDEPLPRISEVLALEEAQEETNPFSIEKSLRAQAEDALCLEKAATVGDPKLAFDHDRY